MNSVKELAEKLGFVAGPEIYTSSTMPDEVIAGFIDKDKQVLHIGTGELPNYIAVSSYVVVDPSNVDALILNKDQFDYVILTDILELIDDPKELISKVKNLAKTTIIYEFKYDSIENINPNWKQPWKSVGLEFFLGQQFDYVNNIFLGFATLHTCEQPYNPRPTEDKEHPDAIR